MSAQVAAIEDLIAQGADMQIVIRLLCLASITAGGIKAKTLENIKREFLQVRRAEVFRPRYWTEKLEFADVWLPLSATFTGVGSTVFGDAAAQSAADHQRVAAEISLFFAPEVLEAAS